jgi:SET domain-containing protein
MPLRRMTMFDSIETPASPVTDLVALRNSPIDGLGCFALAPFDAGSFIAEYRGQVITEPEAVRRDCASYAGYSAFVVHLEEGWFIDGAIGGGDIRFLNHSCAANCELVLSEGRVFVAAARQITEGEELTIDYEFDRGPGFDCKCGNPDCRGTPYSVGPEDKC